MKHHIPKISIVKFSSIKEYIALRLCLRLLREGYSGQNAWSAKVCFILEYGEETVAGSTLSASVPLSVTLTMVLLQRRNNTIDPLAKIL